MEAEFDPQNRDHQKAWLLERIEEEAGDMLEEVRLRDMEDPEYSPYAKGFREGLMKAYANTAVQFGLMDDSLMYEFVKNLTGQTDFDLRQLEPGDEPS